MGGPRHEQAPAGRSGRSWRCACERPPARPRYRAALADPQFVAPGVRPYVTVRAEDEGGIWRCTIEDDGVGREPCHAERVFGMFQRLHTRDRFEGTGIGLAIARKVIERHGGEIAAAAREEGGSRFTFTLPRSGA